jgi:putative ABC transport system permease protein
MFGYYLDLAWRSLRRNKVLTTLMVLAIARVPQVVATRSV